MVLVHTVVMPSILSWMHNKTVYNFINGWQRNSFDFIYNKADKNLRFIDIFDILCVLEYLWKVAMADNSRRKVRSEFLTETETSLLND